MNAGLVYAACAFTWWGLFPIYIRLVTSVPAAEILAHRVVWCLLFVGAALSWRGQWAWLWPVARQPRVLFAFMVSALLIGGNWLAYIWAVSNGHVLDASLELTSCPGCLPLARQRRQDRSIHADERDRKSVV